MCVDQGRQLPESAARAILTKYWNPRVADNIRDVKSMSDGSGICFDVYSKDADGFIENYNHLKASQDARRVDFDVSRCKTLPPVQAGNSGGGGYGGGQSNSYGGSSRGNGGGYGDRGGGDSSGNNRYGGGRGGGGGYSGGGASGGYGSKPSGGYGGNSNRDERDYGGNNQGGGGDGWGGGATGWNKENQPSNFNAFDENEYSKPSRYS